MHLFSFCYYYIDNLLWAYSVGLLKMSYTKNPSMKKIIKRMNTEPNNAFISAEFARLQKATVSKNMLVSVDM